MKKDLTEKNKLQQCHEHTHWYRCSVSIPCAVLFYRTVVVNMVANRLNWYKIMTGSILRYARIQRNSCRNRIDYSGEFPQD